MNKIENKNIVLHDDEYYYSVLRRNVKAIRIEKGLTQQELGDMVGIGFRAVSKWERGITMPDISIINDLSKILGITSDELLSGEVKEINIPKENKKSSKTIKITKQRPFLSKRRVSFFAAE